jgi:phosphoglycolate phosphatase-like HAD superfamily hydrolase
MTTNRTITALRAVNETDTDRELAMENQRMMRERSQDHKMGTLAQTMKLSLRAAEQDLERLADEREVSLAKISNKADDVISAVQDQIKSLTAQLEENQARMKRHEAAKIRLMSEARSHYEAEIAKAKQSKDVCEAAIAGLAKSVN